MGRSIVFTFFAHVMCIAISNAQNSCDNIVPNGDFQSGNVSFSSGLPQACNACTAGTYCVTNNFTGKCSSWPSVFDNTFGNASGLFLAIDGSTTGANAVWSATGIPVVPGVTYEFSFYISTVFGPAQQQFDIGQIINSVNVSTVTISQTVGSWIRYSSTWTCPPGVTSIPLEIRQLTQGAFRDFGIDDISFRCISCEADFAFTHLDDCGLVSFSDFSYGQFPVSHFWNFGDPASGSNNTSNAMNPTHQFTECRSFDVCLTITTANGCVSEKCQSVVVTDTIPPIAICLGVGLEMGNNCQAIVTPSLIDGGSSDNCLIQSMSVSPSIIYTCGEFPVTLTVTDWCGNSSTCQTTVQTAEANSPLITCPSDILIHCDDDTDPANTGFATATDDCTSIPIMSYSDQISGIIPCDGGIIRTWIATDSCGNESSCLQQIFIIDNVVPTITGCPSDISVTGNIVNGICQADVTVMSPLASDNCDNDVTLINDFNNQLDASGIYQPGSTLVIWTATDDCGNTATCSFSVTVECEPCDSVSVLTGITGYYPFYKNADDLSSFGNNGTVNGATLTTGHDLVNNSAYLFNGSSSSILAGTHNRGITNKVTVAAWVKTTETTNGQWVAGKYSFSDDRGYLLSIGDNVSNSIGQVSFSGRDGSGIYHSSGFSPTRVNDGEWHCIVGTAGNGFWKVYVDGILQNSAAGSSSDLTTSGEPFTIGWHTNSSFPFWMNGAIDDLLIYNRDLSEEDIRCLCGGIVPPVSTCCEDFDTFCENVENAIDILLDNDSCKVTFQIGDLPECDYIEWVNWGDSMQSTGNFVNGDMPMHVYSGSGTYIISYLAIELDDDGFICFEKIIQDTIQVDCLCGCGGFTDLFVRSPQGAMSQQVFCNNSTPVQLTCSSPGSSYNISGLLQCNGGNCPPVTNVQWVLTGPAASQTGIVGTNPYFNVQLLPTYFPVPGNYSLALSGICGNDTCTCILNFVNDCPDLCPCDVQAMSNSVDQGFAVVKYPTSCKACFVPIDLSDCDSVEWHMGSNNGPVIGNSTGNNAICHVFPGTGTYTVVMIVTRKKSDGSLCEVFTKSQQVSLSCLIIADCRDSNFPNPGFNLGATGGGMLSGGMVDGWRAASGEPIVVEGSSGSFDAWTIQLSGNFDTSDVLTSLEPICIKKAEGTFSFRMAAKKHPDNEGKRERPCDVLRVAGHGWTSSVPATGQLGFIPLDLLDSTEWIEVEVPFDLSTRTEFETCSASNNGVFIQAVISVTNALGSDQGGEDTYSYVQLDNFCFNGTNVTALNNLDINKSVRIYPNPNSGIFTVELPEAASAGMHLSIIDLTGQVLLKKVAEVGSIQQTMEIDKVPPGLYFLKVEYQDRMLIVEKIVKHD